MTEQQPIEKEQSEQEITEENTTGTINVICDETECKDDEDCEDEIEDDDDDYDDYEDDDFEYHCPACSALAMACKFITKMGPVMIPRENLSYIFENTTDNTTTVATKDGHKFILTSNIITNFFENGCVDIDSDDCESELTV